MDSAILCDLKGSVQPLTLAQTLGKKPGYLFSTSGSWVPECDERTNSQPIVLFVACETLWQGQETNEIHPGDPANTWDHIL